MSRTHNTAVSSSNFQLIFNNALEEYQKRTKINLLAHPLAAQFEACNSPDDVLAVFNQHFKGLVQSRSNDERWTRWLDPTVNVLYAFSTTLGASLLFSPASVILAGVGVLLSAAKDVRASQDAFVDLFENIEIFFRRLEIYTEVRPTSEMLDKIVRIMVEVLSILAIATKDIKQSRIKKYAKKVIGRTDLEDALKRLDKLTHEEARMAISEHLKAIDNKVAGRVRVVDDKVPLEVAEVIRDGKETKVTMQQTATDVDQGKRNQLRESIHKWLSPANPSTNHNIACSTHYKKTASWFVQGNIFQEWKSTSSLLWIHGKPGSGKSVLCSTVIQDIEAMCKAGNASMAYFYFDFRDSNKQGLRDLVPSLLTQLSARSGPCCDILSSLYLAHDKGKTQPSDSTLAECLKQMLTLPDQPPTYLIIDALDESPDNCGIPSPRERVLQLVKELVELRHSNIHICVTSRPEIDIQDVLEPLTPRRVSLHDQNGQRKDIEDYIKSVVYSNSEPIMKRWRTDDKELVVEMLSERAEGMFRWVFCQLETLRRCFPPSVRHTLNDLPHTLDETYERVLKDVKKHNRDYALRLLQCLVVAIRPLRVEELAEVLAVDFRDEEGIPRLNPNWRWKDQEQAILTSCSSLIYIGASAPVPDEPRIVQFSHFSVKEYLTSDRLATSGGFTSRYYISFEPAHTILAQACVSVLLHLEDRIKQCGVRNRSPLATYAAEHWVTHARGKKNSSVQKELGSSSLQRAMEYLFDQDRPYFAAWLQLHDIDTATLDGSTFYQFTPYSKSSATPLYYAALCGFQDLVEHLVVGDPVHIYARGGYYLTPLVAALAGGHMQIAQFLHESGAGPNVRGRIGMTPLHSAAFYGEFKMVQVLLKYEADVNAWDSYGKTPLHHALEGSNNGGPNFDLVRLLLEHGADVNARGNDHATPLHLAVQYGRIEVVRVLLEHGANVAARDSCGRTAFRVASQNRRDEIMKLLAEYGFQNMAPITKKANDPPSLEFRPLLPLLEDPPNLDIPPPPLSAPPQQPTTFGGRKQAHPFTAPSPPAPSTPLPGSRRQLSVESSLSQSTSSTSESNKWRLFRPRRSQSTPDTSPSVYNDPLPPDTPESGYYKKASRMVPSRSVTMHIALPQSRNWEPVSPVVVDYMEKAANDSEPLLRPATDGTVSAGNLEGLVSRVISDTAYSSGNDRFRTTFLLITICPLFATSERLFSVLKRRFESAELDLAPQRSRYSILLFIESWLKKGFEDKELKCSSTIKEFVLALVGSETISETMESKAREIASLIDDPHFVRLRQPKNCTQFRLDPAVRPQGVAPAELAAAVTAVEADLFECITYWDYVNFTRQRSNVQRIQEFNNLHDLVTVWVQTTVLQSDFLDERMETYEGWIYTAEACRRLNNFSSTSAIVIALMSPIVTRLTITCENKAKPMLYALAQDLTPTDGAYQNTLEKVATKEVIPWLDRHLSTLNSSFAHSNPIVLVDGHPLIDFKQCSEIAEQIESLVQYSPPRTRDSTRPDVLAYVEYSLRSSSGDDALRAAEERSANLVLEEQSFLDRREKMRRLGLPWSPPRRR